MKKALLLLMAAGSMTAASAQVFLTGTSYTQNFDNIASGLPLGWSVDTAATATSLGGNVNSTKYTATPTKWSLTTGGFRNSASATGFASYAAGDTASQTASTNRALSVRQVSAASTTFGGSDPGAAFELNIANTTNLSNFSLSFKLQGLDSTSSRITTWTVDYGVGATPTTFTPAGSITGTLTTGGNIFSNNTVTASFGTALNNLAGPVWIRIVTLTATTGSGNRGTTGIDDVNLTWTGTAAGSLRPTLISSSPINGATNVPLTSSLTLTFNRGIIKGTAGSIYIKNETDQTTQTIPVSSASVSVAANTATITGLTLANSKTYHVTFDSTAFDTLTYHSFGLYDTSALRFSTPQGIVTVSTIFENFDAACAAGGLPAGWSKQNVQGPGQTWGCYTPTGSTNAAMQINGYAAGANNVNEDWLITPRILPNNVMALFFRLWKRFTGPELDVLTSTNYDGTSAPSTASWTSLNIPMAAADTAFYKDFGPYLNPAPTQPFYIAFKYTSTAAAAYQMRLDSVVVTIPTGIANVSSMSNNLPVSVIGNAANGHVQIAFNTANAGAMQAGIYDLAGRLVYHTTLNAVKGENKAVLVPESLQSSLYIIRLGNGMEQGIARTFIQ